MVPLATFVVQSVVPLETMPLSPVCAPLQASVPGLGLEAVGEGGPGLTAGDGTSAGGCSAAGMGRRPGGGLDRDGVGKDEELPLEGVILPTTKDA